MKNFNPSTLTLIAIIALVAFLRVLQVFPPNFAPVTALCLLGSAYFSRKWMAFIIPTSILIISDLILGGTTELIAVYVSYALIITLGYTLQNKVKPARVALVTLSSSLIFYIVTNFACWYGSSYYTQDLNGLIINYTGALPFFRTSLISDLIFSASFFAVFETVKVKFPRFATNS